jgi:hypothetical protein
MSGSNSNRLQRSSASKSVTPHQSSRWLQYLQKPDNAGLDWNNAMTQSYVEDGSDDDGESFTAKIAEMPDNVMDIDSDGEVRTYFNVAKSCKSSALRIGLL